MSKITYFVGMIAREGKPRRSHHQRQRRLPVVGEPPAGEHHDVPGGRQPEVVQGRAEEDDDAAVL